MHGAPGHVGACFREEPVNGTRHDFLGQQSRDGRCRNCNSSSFLVTAPSSCVESTPACPPRLDDSGACPQAPQAEPPLSLLRQVGRDGGRSGVPFTLASQSIKGEPRDSYRSCTVSTRGSRRDAVQGNGWRGGSSPERCEQRQESVHHTLVCPCLGLRCGGLGLRLWGGGALHGPVHAWRTRPPSRPSCSRLVAVDKLDKRERQDSAQFLVLDTLRE
jgi:hypothetical protein